LASVLSIDIGMNPNVGHVFGLLLTWHGVFTAVGIIAGVWLAVRIASSERVGIDPDTAYTLGMIVVACGIVGARALYVIERYGDPGIDSVGAIFRINEGGISIYGAIIGGAIGGWAYGLWRRLQCAAGADAAVYGMLIGLALGRIGDIINGEHLAKASDLAWAVTYSNPNSPGFEHTIVVGPSHPAVAYEMLGDLVILGILALLWRLRLKSGVIFALAFLFYGVMRFGVSFLRVDSKEPAFGLTTPELVSLIVIPVAGLLALFFLVRKEPPRPEFEQGPDGTRTRRAPITRAERRRRLRSGSVTTGRDTQAR
jgi:phosphatidylglycerol:prolipoprotein diacylglycerol transferase